MMVKKFLVFYFLVAFVQAGLSQDVDTLNTKPQVLGLKAHYGFIIAHRTALRGVSQSNPRGLQAEWSKQHITQQAWNYCGCYPRIGFSFWYTNFGDPNVLGNSYAASAFIEPLFIFSGRFKPSFRLGFGLTYLDRLYDETTNPSNLFFSYPVSFLLHADLNLRYTLNEKWNITLEASYPHISNGGIEQPNKGINFPVAKLGAEFNLEPLNFVRRTKSLSLNEMYPDRWFGLTQFFFSRKDVVDNQGKYSVLGISTSYHRIVGRLSALHGGIDAVHDRSAKERNTHYTNTDHRTNTFSVFAGHDLLLGKFIFSQQVGLYLEKPSPATHDLYQRIGLQYRFTEQLQGGISLKTHTSVADFVDVRLGIRW